MKKWNVALIAAVGLATASSALASLNPASPGLPGALAYGTSTVLNNQASAMCVDCHSVNPLAKHSTARYAWQTPVANFQGSHYVYRAYGSGFDATNTGGGITYGTKVPRVAGQYIATGAWTVASRVSKYANGDGSTAPTTSYATDLTVVHNATLDATAANYNTRNLICESCHSIVSNVAGGRNLLGGDPTATTANGKNVGIDAEGNTGICEGCHGNMTVADHGNNQPDNNNHHVVTITANSANIISNAKATAKLLWTRAQSITGTDNRAMNTAPSYASAPMSEVGYQVAAAWTGGVAGKQAGGVFNCTDCHAYGHGGRTDTAGRLLRSGNTPATEVGYFNATNAATRWAARTYTERLQDMIGQTGAPTILKNDQGYCEGCHTYAK